MRLAARPAIARLAAIDLAVRGGGYPNASTIARQLEVCPRTIQRDIEFLRDRLGAPLEFEPVRNGYRYSSPTFTLPLVTITQGELVALCLAAQILDQYRGTPFAQQLTHVMGRLRELLPDAVEMHPGDAAAAVSVVPGTAAEQNPHVFRTLATAAVAGERLEIDYYSAGRNAQSTRRIDPYRLALIHGDWYVIAYCHRRRDVRMFASHRVHAARPVGETFDRPADFSVADYLGASFRAVRGQGRHRVTLWFAPAAAARATERRWHASQTATPCSDGGVLVSFTVSDLREVKRWVLSWGADCAVREPQALADQVIDELSSMAGRYRDRKRRARPTVARRESRR